MMRIVIVGGCRKDEEHLARAAAGAGLEIELEQRRRGDELEYDQAAAESSGDADDEHDPAARPRALVFEARDRPDQATLLLRAARGDSYLDGVPTLVAVSPGHVARLDTATGFDDFLLHPYVEEELYGRLRALEWRRIDGEERQKLDGLVVDRAGHEVHVDGRVVQLTAKEFALLAYLCERRGRVLSREHLLARVWGNRYEGGSRTVDIHVRRLRAKLGPALPLETLRGSGYKLRRRAADAIEGLSHPPE
jgi:DNA-binding winged helix-turn-helix (wHTH) protein